MTGAAVPVQVIEAANVSPSSPAPSHYARRHLLAAAIVALTVQPLAAIAEEAGPAVAQISGSTELPETVYFGNGCFWGRQKSFVDAEKALGRVKPEEISSVVGYAGGKKAGPGNRVCYYYSDRDTVYESLGHAEVVQVNLSKAASNERAKQEFKSFADAYFTQFRKTRFGMLRLDPQDAGPGYRNVVGIPGGVKSPLFEVLKEANVNNMELREGSGNEYNFGRASEDDLFNVVWVVDSTKLPFYRAERYHQFHSGIGEPFPREYTQELKAEVAATGRIDPTGCVEIGRG